MGVYLQCGRHFSHFSPFFSTEKKNQKTLFLRIHVHTLSQTKKVCYRPVTHSGKFRGKTPTICLDPCCPCCSLFLKVFFLLVIYCNMCQNVLTSIFFICYCYNRQMYTTHRIPVCYSNSCKRSQFRPDCSLN